MIAIGSYLVFIISLVEMTISVNASFSEENIAQLLNHIYELHNEARRHHGVAELLRTDELDVKAFEEYDNIYNNGPNYKQRYESNFGIRMYNNYTKLNIEMAKSIFKEWYKREDEYCYFFEPLKNIKDDFTRIVWRNTERIGMTFRTRRDIFTVLVIYDPPGNIKGQYTSNVMIPPSLAVERISYNNMLYYQGDEDRFLYYILELHNAKRENHGAQILEIDEDLNNKAGKLLRLNFPVPPSNHRMNILMRNLTLDFKMDAAEADAIFSEWCNDADAFSQIVWKKATMFGISMKTFNHTYKIIALYGPPRNDDKFPQYIEQGESSEYN